MALQDHIRFLDRSLAPEPMAAVFSDRARVQTLLDFEAGLARALADAGVIPNAAVAAIVPQCRVQLYNLDALGEDAAGAGNLALPLVKALTERVARKSPDAARYVHWGATSQDAIDTAFALQLRAALDLFEVNLARLNDELARLALEHRHTLMLGRTSLQPAAPVTFGLKVAGWLSALDRMRDRLWNLREHVLVIQFGGSVGTLASLGLRGLDVAMRLAGELKLGLPELPWHAQRDRVVEAAAALGVLGGSLGKLARDLALMMQAEVAEVAERQALGRVATSSLPHKRNPVGVAAMLEAALRVPALVSALFSALPQEHERGLGGWQLEWTALPEICLLTSSSLTHAVALVEGLEVDPLRMRHNLDETRGRVMAELVVQALVAHMDRAAAHELVSRACRRSADLRRALRDVLEQDPAVRSRLSERELDRLFDPTHQLGVAEVWIDRVVQVHEAKRQPKRG